MTRKQLHRRKHPEKRRAQRERYYARSRAGAVMRKTRWTDEELEKIMSAHRPVDNMLARVLKRSVAAIHAMRCEELKRRKRFMANAGKTAIMH